MDSVFFDPKKKSIVRKLEKSLKVGTQPEVVTMTDKNVMKGTNQDPMFLELVTVAATQANADNVGKLARNVEHYIKECVR